MNYLRTSTVNVVAVILGVMCAEMLLGANPPQSIYKSRRQQVIAALEPGSVAIFRAAPVAHRNGDVDYEYRQDSNFYYLTGFDEPESALLLIKEKRSVPGVPAGVQEVIFLREKNPAMEIWTGYRLGVEAAPESLLVDAALPITGFDAAIDSLAAEVKIFYARQSVARGLRALYRDGRKVRGLRIKSPATILNPMRLHKDTHELALLQKAIDITAQAHVQVMRAARPGMYEYELEALLEYIFKRMGSERPGFPSIVGSGPNSCILHYQSNRRKIRPGEMVVVDIGAEYGMYTADITRTIPIDGRFSPEQRTIYELVLAAQDSGIAAAQPGNSFRAPHKAALRVIVRGMIGLGFLKGSVEENIENGTYRDFFMHGSSHYLGMDVHDVGGTPELQPGQVITVEPGIYLSAATCEKLGIPKAYSNIGVRIEDDVLITPTGPKLLSGKAPRRVEDIERLMMEKAVLKSKL